MKRERCLKGEAPGSTCLRVTWADKKALEDNGGSNRMRRLFTDLKKVSKKLKGRKNKKRQKQSR
jgi:hypothetical protein